MEAHMRPRGRSAWRVAGATAAVAFIIGIAVGHWAPISTETLTAGIVGSDVRPRPPEGEARLIMDQRFEEFSRRVSAQERAGAATPPSETTQPAASTTRPSEPRRAGS